MNAGSRISRLSPINYSANDLAICHQPPAIGLPMLFQNDPENAANLVATDYWSSPAGLAGKPVLSYSEGCFRLLVPVKATVGPRHAELVAIMTAIEATTYPEIYASPAFVAIVAGRVAMTISWTEVDGITLDKFPTHPQACEFLTYTFAGKRGPRKSFGRKATYSQPG